MAGVAATVPELSAPRFPGIFSLLEDGANTTPNSRLERIATLPLGERPPLVMCFKDTEPHICVLWGAQFVTLSFSQPTPEDRKVLAFSRDIRLGLLPATVVVQPEWLTPADMAVSPAADMEALLARLAPRHPHLPQDTIRT